MTHRTFLILFVTILLMQFGYTPVADAKNYKGDIHIVKKGDTLWDISNKYLDSPYFWPKLWQWNEHIGNPHLIYPGDEIRISPPPVAVKRIVREIEPPEEVIEPEEVVEEEEEVIDIVEDEPPVVVEKPPVRGGKFNIRDLRATGFVTPKDLNQAGHIIDTADEKTMLSTGDKVYVVMKSAVEPGDIFTVFKPTKEIIHPIDKKSLGFKIDILGRIIVRSFDDGLATAEIIESFDVMEIEDLVKPYEDLPEEITVREASALIEGHIAASREGISIFAETDVVFLDVGSNDGVEIGNLFIVYKEGKKFEDKKLKKSERKLYQAPPITIGKLIVYDVKEATSTAVILNSIGEMMAGEKIKSIVQ